MLRTHAVRCCPAAALLACICGAAAPALGQFAFDTEPIRQDGMWNTRSSIGLDEAGVVHVAFARQSGTDSTTSEVWYAQDEGAGCWSFTQVTNNTVREEFPDLTLDSEGNVHIAVHTGVSGGNKVRYTNNTSGSFFDPVDITGAGFIIVSVAVDGAGTAHFAFQSQTTNLSDDIYYASRNAAGVVSGPLRITNSSSWDTDANIAVDGAGNVHIVWDKGNTLGYVNNVGGSFAEVPTGVASTAEYPIVLIGPNDAVNIIYRESINNGLVWAIDNVGGSFSVPEPVIPAFTYRPAQWDGMAIDAAGHRYLCFSSNGSTTTQGVFFVGETDAGFQPPVFLGDSTSSNQDGSVAINSSGKIAASYQFSGFDGVVFADLYVATLQMDFDPDLDGNGTTDVFDLLAYLDDWFVSACPADIDDVDGVDVFDLLFYLDFWFAA